MSVRVIYGVAKRNFIGADVDIDSFPYYTYVTAYMNPINLTHPNRDGHVLCIYNDSGSVLIINSDINIQGAATDQLSITNGSWIELMYLNNEDVTERYRDIGGSPSGVTLQ